MKTAAQSPENRPGGNQLGDDVSNNGLQFSWNIKPLDNKCLPASTEIEPGEPEANSIQFEFENNIPKADRVDYMVAASIGALSSILNIFWQKDFDLEKARNWGSEKINAFVIEMAKSQGYKPKANTKDDILRAAIKYLEKEFEFATDKATAQLGGGLQHHLRDFGHHPTPIGLLFSILTQFTGRAYGTNALGDFLIVMLPDDAAIGTNFYEKITFGTVRWFFHLVSDMAGSSNNPGAGTGIPGLLLSTLKELSALPFFKNFNIDYKNSDITLSKFVAKLFNGTAIRGEGGEPIRFDLKTEIGILDQALSQTRSVIANECIVRGYYFVSRLLTEIKLKEITSITDIYKINPERVLPRNNRALNRMLTISSSAFVAVNIGNAAIRAALKSGGSKSKFAKGVVVQLNYFGIARMAIAVKNDAPYIAEDLKELIEGRFGDYARFARDFGLLELGPQASRVLHSIEALVLEDDICKTKTKSPRQAERKAEWATQWREKIAFEIDVDERTYFLSEKRAYAKLLELKKRNKTASWEILFVLELAQFEPYAPFEKQARRPERLQCSSDYLRKVLPAKQDFLTSKRISSILSLRDCYERKLTGSTTRLVASGVAVAAITVATGGVAYAFAPVIAPMIAGEAVAGLSGAALASASLAAIGGGSLATGGLGMAGGTAILAGGGALLGLAGSSTVAATAIIEALPERYVLNECCKLLTFVEAESRESGNRHFARKASIQLERLLEATRDKILMEETKGKETNKREVKNLKAICKYLEKSIAELVP